jgi:hypothetical protein
MPSGHERKSAIHGRAISYGAKIKRHENLDDETTLVEYDVSDECYLYFKSVRGPHRVDKKLNFEQIVDAWLDDTIDLPSKRAFEVKFNKRRRRG